MIGSADARRAALYRSLAAFESAGIPFRDALDRVGDPVLDAARVAIEKGASIADGVAGAPAISRLESKLGAGGAEGGRAARGLPHSRGDLRGPREAQAAARARPLVPAAPPPPRVPPAAAERPRRDGSLGLPARRVRADPHPVGGRRRDRDRDQARPAN